MDTKKLMDTANQIQKECHLVVDYVMSEDKGGKMSYQDATNVFLFKKLAELQIKIELLQTEQIINDL